MTIKRILGILCFVLAILFAMSGARTVTRGMQIDDPSGLGVSQAVGAFLPSLLALIVGLLLFKKPIPK